MRKDGTAPWATAYDWPWLKISRRGCYAGCLEFTLQ